MMTVLLVLHVLVCLTLILVVLLQRGKGSDIGAALGGGGSNTVFGSRGAGNFLTKMTTGAAIIFMLTSLSLAYLRTENSRSELFDSDFEAPAVGPVLEESEEATTSGGGLEEIEFEEVEVPVPAAATDTPSE